MSSDSYHCWKLPIHRTWEDISDDQKLNTLADDIMHYLASVNQSGERPPASRQAFWGQVFKDRQGRWNTGQLPNKPGPIAASHDSIFTPIGFLSRDCLAARSAGFSGNMPFRHDRATGRSRGARPYHGGGPSRGRGAPVTPRNIPACHAFTYAVTFDAAGEYASHDPEILSWIDGLGEIAAILEEALEGMAPDERWDPVRLNLRSRNVRRLPPGSGTRRIVG